MSLSTFFSESVGTVSGWINYAWDGTPTASQLQARGDAADARLNSIDQTQYAPGGSVYQSIADSQGQDAADATYAVVQGDLSASTTGDVAGQIGTAAEDAAVQSAKELANKVSNPLSTIWKLIPIQWWVLIAVGLGVWLYSKKKN